MVITYSDAVLRTFVAQICRDMGWHASHMTSLEVLTQIASTYIRQLAKQCVQFANHGGRQSANLDDMALAFNHFNIELSELKDYVHNVESTALEVPVPKYPVANVSNRVVTNTAEDEERPEWYYEWMPPLRESRTSGSADETGDQSKPIEDTLQDGLTSPTSVAQEPGGSSPKRNSLGIDSFGLLRDLYTPVGQREGRLPDTQRIIESDDSRDHTPEREVKPEEKVKVEDKKKEKKKDKKELKEERKKLKLSKESSLKIKAIISKNKIKGEKKEKDKKLKKFLKIKELGKRPYSPLSIKVTGLSTGTPTATSTPTMARSPASVASPDGQRSNANVDSSIDAVIGRVCAEEEMKSSPKGSEDIIASDTPKKKYKIKREDSAEKRTKKSKKENLVDAVAVNETIDAVVRQSQNALLSPHKRSPHHSSPKVKSEPKESVSQKPLNAQTFDDDEAAQILVSMASDKSTAKRKKGKPAATTTSSSPSNDNSSNSAFQSALNSFPKVSPGTSPYSPTMYSMPNQNPVFPTPPLFGHMSPHTSPPLLTPHDSYPPPILTKPKTLAEKKALPPEIMNAPVIKKEKDKENKTDKKDRDKDRKDKKSQKLKNKKFKSRTTISDDSSSEEEVKPKINIKLSSSSKPQPSLTDKLSVKTTSEAKPPPKTLLSPKHNVHNPEDQSMKKKRGPKKKIKEEIKETDKSCVLIRETIIVDTGDGDGKVWICPACKGPDDGSPMIACDACEDAWYHWSCVGITRQPTASESWFCRKCVKQQAEIVTQTSFKKKETKKRPNLMQSSKPPELKPKPPSNKPQAMRPRGRPRKDSSSIATPIPKKERRTSSDEEMHEQRRKEKLFRELEEREEEEPDEYICPQCTKPDDGTPMIQCDKCDEWFHWQCVGILTEPKADSNWMCTFCKKKKQSLSGPPRQSSAVSQRTLSTSPIVPLTKYQSASQSTPAVTSSGNQWQCPTCKKSVDNVTPSICCDDCDNWYHWHCVGITTAPDESESWFCSPCIEKQAKTLAIAYKLAKVRRI